MFFFLTRQFHLFWIRFVFFLWLISSSSSLNCDSHTFRSIQKHPLLPKNKSFHKINDFYSHWIPNCTRVKGAQRFCHFYLCLPLSPSFVSKRMRVEGWFPLHRSLRLFIDFQRPPVVRCRDEMGQTLLPSVGFPCSNFEILCEFLKI